MLPADPDARVVWACFVIARHKDGLGLSDIVAEAKRWRMPMTRADVLKILRRYVDLFDKDLRLTREREDLMTDWAKVLRAIAPKGKSSIISGLAQSMPAVIETAALRSVRRQAHFLAQLAHESDGFRTTVEYASGAAYEDRRDLGNTQPGDGVRFKGRGLIQLTGRANYAEFGKLLGVDLVADPALAARFPYAALTAALYWKRRALNADADADDVRAVTRKINGGYNGLAARQAYLKAAKRALATPQPKPPPEEEATEADLRKAGSRTMDGTSQIKSGLVGVGATVAGSGATAALNQVSDTVSTAQSVVSNVQTVHEAAKAAPGMVGWLHVYWPHLLIGLNVILALACAYFVWRIYAGARRVERAKVEDTNEALALGGDEFEAEPVDEEPLEQEQTE
jgi:putative chitinase